MVLNILHARRQFFLHLKLASSLINLSRINKIFPEHNNGYVHQLTWGRGGVGGRFFLRNSTPCRPKGSPLHYFVISIFFDGNFSKAPLTPIYTDFWGGGGRGDRAEKNAIFWSKLFKNCLKMPFLACIFKILPAAQKVSSKW